MTLSSALMSTSLSQSPCSSWLIRRRRRSVPETSCSLLRGCLPGVPRQPLQRLWKTARCKQHCALKHCLPSFLPSVLPSSLHSFIHPFVHPFIHPSIHAFIHSIVVHSVLHETPCIHASPLAFTLFSIRPFILSCIHSLIHCSFMHLLVTQFDHTFSKKPVFP